LNHQRTVFANAAQVSASSTLNLRGERSVIGNAECDSPGDEPVSFKAAAHEQATKHRKPPPAFGPVAGKP
jgi:hypothetical protein